MDHDPTPSSPHSPDTSTTAHKRQASRACDRCRRRKARCDFAEPGQRCTNCRESGANCLFDLPVARRGPKTRRKRAPSTGEAHASTSPGSFRANPTSTAQLEALVDANSSTPLGTASAQWDSVDLGLTPPTISTSMLNDNDNSINQPPSAFKRWQSLSAALALITSDPQRLVTRCFDLFFEYLYPLTPLVHEPSLRDSLSHFTARIAAPDAPSRGTGVLELWPETSFTLITAVCAEAAFLLPKDLFP
ncbi:hypothetical protein FZEAL_7511 [Fusarium zealandicum]|uniref:Zn(2)-C6 fungal-type domain-containing protein n=1 Tax=Fusarium zealandicum TaxID=1053134 RepID=A0A8H4UFQ1_9HYPO|nr:hypothetical protein FZEAL_7511 [Fusarium zealandicum]